MTVGAINTQNLTDIADAIRSKSGLSDTFKPSEMAQGILDIPSGGITPSGTIQISSNGTHDVTNYASANVNVPSQAPSLDTKTITENGTYSASDDSLDGYSSVTVNVSGGGSGYTADEIATGQVPSGAVTLTGTTIAEYAFYKNNALTSLSSESVATLSNYAFSNCANLTSVSLPNAVNNSPISIFQRCSSLLKIGANDLARIRAIGNSMFAQCSALTVIVMPYAREINYQCTHQCSALTTIDIGQTTITGGNGIASGAFGTCNALTKLILRRSTLIPLGNVNAFANTPFKNGGTGGEIYVPSALIDTYKSASNWSTLDGYGTVTWKAIEGSEYENTYADGTPIA